MKINKLMIFNGHNGQGIINVDGPFIEGDRLLSIKRLDGVGLPGTTFGHTCPQSGYIAQINTDDWSAISFIALIETVTV